MNRVAFCAALVSGLWLAGAPGAFGQSLSFNTVAGYAGQGSTDGNHLNAGFYNPSSVAADSDGNVYVADTANHTIRLITAGGVVSTLAGAAGVSGSANGTGGAARFNQPQGIAVDSAGNVYVADTGNQTIRMIASGGVVSTLAGLAGVSGTNNGTGGNARFYQPEGVAVDAAGNVYVADTWNHTIRQITSGGVVSTLAGLAGVAGTTNGAASGACFYQPQGVAVDSSGNVYVADTGNQTIRMITSGGVVSTLAGSAGNYGSTDGTGPGALFYGPAGVAVDGLGFVYVADYFNQTIRRVTSAGVVSTLAGSVGNYGSADGTHTAARFWYPAGVAVRGTNTGTVYVADSGNGTIRSLVSVSGNWVSSTLAGSASTGSTEATGSAARFYSPGGMAVDGSGNLYVADTQNGTIRKAAVAGPVGTLAGSAGKFGTTDGVGNKARFYGPQGLAVDGAGTVYVADTINAAIRKITAGGVVSTLAGSPGTNGCFNGTGNAASFYEPRGVAVDGDGTVYVADTWNHTIRKVTAAGVVTTLAGVPGGAGCTDGTGPNVGTNTARFNYPAAVALDRATNVYVADYFNHTVRKVTPAGVVSTLAGLPGVWGSADGMNSAARFYEPAGIVVDGGGNVYVLDSGNHTIRRLAPSGTNWVVSTVAGLATVSGLSDGTGSSVRFNYPAGLAVDGAGLLYVADTGNNTVRKGFAVIDGTPAIVAQPQSQTLSPGSGVAFTVSAVGVAPLSYQWRFNAAAIAGATDSSYTRANVQGADGGNYSVVVANSRGSAVSADAMLTVSGPPFITGEPQDQAVSPGQNATFSVIASGTAPLSYQWRFKGSSLPGATSPSFTLSSAQRTNQGLYSVVVTNASGVAVSSDALLAIIGLEAWGDNTFGQLNVSAQAFDVVQIAVGAWHSLALRGDGSVVAWGNNSDGQCDVPKTLQNVLGIAGGGYHSLAMQADGTVVAWGANDYAQTNVPADLASVIGVSAGTWHSLALRRDGTVVAWGDNSLGQTNVPVGLSNVVAIAAGGNHSLALQDNGKVVAWGENTDAEGNYVGQSIVPPDLASVVALAGGEYHSLAVRADGTVVAWGGNSQGQINVPLGLSNVVAVSGGGAHSLALCTDGTVAAWGANWNGQCNLPSDLNDVVGIGAGESHSVALPAGSFPVPQLLSPARQGGRFSALVQTLNRMSYALEFKSPVSDTNWTAVTTNTGNGAVQQLIDPAPATSQGYYRMRQW